MRAITDSLIKRLASLPTSSGLSWRAGSERSGDRAPNPQSIQPRIENTDFRPRTRRCWLYASAKGVDGTGPAPRGRRPVSVLVLLPVRLTRHQRSASGGPGPRWPSAEFVITALSFGRRMTPERYRARRTDFRSRRPLIESSRNNAYAAHVHHYSGRHETIRDRRAVGKASSPGDRPPAGRDTVSRGCAAARGIVEFGSPVGTSVSPGQAERAARSSDSRTSMSLVGSAAGAAEGAAAPGRRRGRVRHRAVDAPAHQ
jgi:hypothetical protein